MERDPEVLVQLLHEIMTPVLVGAGLQLIPGEVHETPEPLQREYPADTYKHVVEERARHKLWIRLTKLGRRHWNHVVRMGGGVMAGFFCNL